MNNQVKEGKEFSLVNPLLFLSPNVPKVLFCSTVTSWYTDINAIILYGSTVVSLRYIES